MSRADYEGVDSEPWKSRCHAGRIEPPKYRHRRILNIGESRPARPAYLIAVAHLTFGQHGRKS